MNKDYLLELIRSPKSVFTINDVALIWEETNLELVKVRMSRYLKAGKMYSIRKGIYAKDKNYDKYELAIKIYTPAYISFETVLASAGILFQYYSQIFVASYLARALTIDNQVYSYKKLKDSILTNNLGIEIKDNYSIASTERAFLDTVYLNKDYYFDNLNSMNWDKVQEMLPIYGDNKRMIRKIKNYQKSAGEKG